MKQIVYIVFCLLAVACQMFAQTPIATKNVSTALYIRMFELEQMKDDNWSERNLDYLQRYVKIEKVYLEVHRDMSVASLEAIQKAKVFFGKKGIKVSAGIATVMNENDNYRTFCYSNPKHVEMVSDMIKTVAHNFDEIIFDDFFFINCKCDMCIKNKGDATWSEFRLRLMRETATTFVETAKRINPKINMIIKYPNWYEHYAYLGYNLKDEPAIFDMIYTGSETRDPFHHPQHLQTYQSYSIMRYMENVLPGKNGGGWVDPYYKGTLDCYSDQLLLTLFSKPKEIALFCSYDLAEDLNVDKTRDYAGASAPVAASALYKADRILGKLGNPVGIASYKPFHSSDEDYLHSYLGMIGLPIEMTPFYPEEAPTIFLTESAKYDSDILNKMKESLAKGKNIIITSGLLRNLEGVNELIELRFNNKVAAIDAIAVDNDRYTLAEKIVIPQISFPTNEGWELVSGTNQGNGYPLLLMGYYGKGKIYVLNVPENMSDFYHYPAPVLSALKNVFMTDLPVVVEAPSKIAQFQYDNGSFIVHSFMPYPQKVKIIVKKKDVTLINLSTDELLKNAEHKETSEFWITLNPHTFQSFSIQ